MAALRRLLPFKRVLSPHLSLSAIAATSINAHMLVSCRLLSTEDRKRADYSDLNNVVQALREISHELGLVPTDKKRQQEQLPDTKALKALGHHELVHAIRKKHGGFVRVAELMGVYKGQDALEIHKQKSSRANRRLKRTARLAKHDFY